MTASPPPPVPPLVKALRDVREILERARRTGDRGEIEQAIERIATDTQEWLAKYAPGGSEWTRWGK